VQTPTPTQTHFLSADDVVAIVRSLGVAECLRGMAEAIRADYLRWQDFDKQARVFSHSETGVIELMPVSDGGTYAFKYVSGHPSKGWFGLDRHWLSAIFWELARSGCLIPTRPLRTS